MTKKNLPAHGSVVDAHKGRTGNNELDTAVIIARVKGLLAELEAGNIKVFYLEGHPKAVEGEHREDGITVKWRLPD